MAKPLTRGQKAAETRKRNAAEREVPPVPRNRTKTLVITAEQFMAGIERLTKGFATLDRLEQIVLAGKPDTRIELPEGGYPIPRITEAPAPKGCNALNASVPVSVLIDDVHSRSSAHRARLEALRDSLVHGIHPDQPRPGGVVQADTPSQGPSKDALNWSFSNLAASEALVEEIERYLLNR